MRNRLLLLLFIITVQKSYGQLPTVFFNKVFTASSGQGGITVGTQLNGQNFKFVGSISTGGVFNATNGEVLGDLIYTDLTPGNAGNNIIYTGKLNLVGTSGGNTKVGFLFEESGTSNKFFVTDPKHDASVTAGASLGSNSSNIVDALNNMRNNQVVLTVNYFVSNFTTCLNTASTAQTFTISGQKLTSSITVTAPTNFEISKDNSASSYSSTLTYAHTSGTLSSSLVYIRLKSNPSTGSYSGNVTISATNAATQTYLVSGGVVSTTSISVNPTNSTVCSGTPTSFSTSADGSSLAYQWQGSTDGGSTYSNLSNTGIYTGVNTSVLRLSSALTSSYNNYKYRCLVTGTCGAALSSTAATLEVNSPVIVATQPSNKSICALGNTNFSIVASGISPTYQWQVKTSSPTAVYENLLDGGVYAGATSSTLSISTAPSSMNGYKYRCVVSGLGACSSNTINSDEATLTINSAPSTPGAIYGNSAICNNTDQSYYISSVSGATSYTWQIPSGWTGSSTTNSINIVNSLNSGVVEVRANNECGSSAFQSLAVTVSNIPAPTPAFTINNQEQCLSSNNFIFTNSSSAANGTTISSYSWDFGDAVGTSSSTNSSYSYSAIGTYNVRLTVAANNGCITSLSRPIVVNGAPTGSITGTTTICEGASATLEVNLTGQSPWILNYTDAASPVLVTSTPYRFSISPAGTKTYTILSLSDSKCAASQAGLTGNPVVTVNSKVTPAVTISTPSTSICATTGGSPTNVTFTSSGQLNQGTSPAYQWLKNGVNIANAVSSTYSTTSLANDDVITLQMISNSTACLSTATVVSNAIQMQVKPGTPISPLAISGDTTQCTSLSNQIYSIVPVLNATSYTWSFPAGWTITSGQGTTTVYATLSSTASSGTVSVTASNGCGTSAPQLLPVAVSTSSSTTITLSSSNSAQTVCLNAALSDITYTSSGGTGASFSGLPQNVTGTYSSGGGITVSGTPTVSGVYNYITTLTGGGCDVATTGTITVSSTNTISLSSAIGTDAQTVCINAPIASLTYSTSGASGANIVGLPTGVQGSFSGNTVTISGTPTVAGTYSYTVTLTGGCGDITALGTITVTAAQSISLTSGPSSQQVCIGSNITPLSYSSIGGTDAVFSGLPSGVIGSYNQGTISITGTPSVSGTFDFLVTLTGGCGVATITGTIGTKQDDEWTSNGNSEVFHTSSNWCRNSIPGAASNIIIPAVASGRFPKLTGNDAAVANIEIRSGARVRLNGRKLVVNGTLSGNGEFTGHSGSTLEFSGNSEIGTLYMDQTDADTKTIGTLIMNRSGKTLVLGSNVIVSDLDLSAGNVDIGDKEFTISSGVSNASSTSFIKVTGIGKVKKNIIGNGASFTFPVGIDVASTPTYNPLTITNNNSSADDFTVNLINEVYRTYDASGVGTTQLNTPRVKRTWNVGKGSPNSGVNVNFEFKWNSGDATAGLTTPVLYHHDNGIWEKQLGNPTITTNGNVTTLTYNNYTGTFSPFAIGDANTALPVTWYSFTASKVQDKVLLNWVTGTENGSKDFEVQYSLNALDWSPLGTVPAAGNSSIPRNYSFTHTTPHKAANAYNYYRILQRDLDGKFSYSKIVSILFSELGPEVLVYPNPVDNVLNIYTSTEQVVSLYNAAGTLVWKAKLPAGRNQLPVNTLSKGVYILATDQLKTRVIIR